MNILTHLRGYHNFCDLRNGRDRTKISALLNFHKFNNLNTSHLKTWGAQIYPKLGIVFVESKVLNISNRANNIFRLIVMTLTLNTEMNFKNISTSHWIFSSYLCNVFQCIIECYTIYMCIILLLAPFYFTFTE